jgi:hypothetical protein
VGRNVLANGLGRWLLFAAALLVSGAMVYAQGTKPGCCAQTAPPTPAGAAQASTPTAPAAGPAGTPPGGPNVATQAEADALAAKAPPAPSGGQLFRFALPRGVAPEDRLQVRTIWAARVIGVLFPQITTIYGYRPDPLPWHPNGLAIDVMIPNHGSPEGIELGNEIAGYALANAKRWGVNHVIWRQKIYPGVGAPSWMSNLGNETLNHYDHVHIATDGGGYPSGQETYYIDSMTTAPPG